MYQTRYLLFRGLKSISGKERRQINAICCCSFVTHFPMSGDRIFRKS